ASALSFRHRASAAAVFAHSQWRRRSQSHNYPFSRPARPFVHISACVLADPRYGTARGFDHSTLPAATCRLGQTCLLKESFHLRTHRNQTMGSISVLRCSRQTRDERYFGDPLWDIKGKLLGVPVYELL